METSKSLLLAGLVARVAGHHQEAMQTQAPRHLPHSCHALLARFSYMAEAKSER